MAGKKKVVIVARRSQTDRRQARRALGTLRDQVIARSTLTRYEKAVALFFKFIEERGEETPESSERMDELASARIEDLWQEGDQRTYAGDLLSGLSHFMESLRGKLPGSWRLFTAWGKAELPCRAPPLSVDICLALIGSALNDNDVALAAAFALAFHALLRTSELVGALAGDLSIDWVEGTGVLNLGLTKGGQRRGVVEHVTLSDSYCMRLLALATAQSDRGDQICKRNSRSLARQFTHYINRLGLGNVGYKVYSLRRGGATYWFKRSGSMESTCERGRWQSARSARIYVNDGLLELLELELSPRQRVLVDGGIAAWRRFLDVPTAAQPVSQTSNRGRRCHLG